MKCRTNDRHCFFGEKHSIFFPDGLVTYGVKMSSTVNTYSCTDTRGQNQIKMSFDMVKQHAVTHSRLIFKKLCVLFLQTGNRSGRCCIMHSVCLLGTISQFSVHLQRVWQWKAHNRSTIRALNYQMPPLCEDACRLRVSLFTSRRRWK